MPSPAVSPANSSSFQPPNRDVASQQPEIIGAVAGSGRGELVATRLL
jgi:hypothetical protein